MGTADALGQLLVPLNQMSALVRDPVTPSSPANAAQLTDLSYAVQDAVAQFVQAQRREMPAGPGPPQNNPLGAPPWPIASAPPPAPQVNALRAAHHVNALRGPLRRA
jgi:hypothetical protein